MMSVTDYEKAKAEIDALRKQLENVRGTAEEVETAGKAKVEKLEGQLEQLQGYKALTERLQRFGNITPESVQKTIEDAVDAATSAYRFDLQKARQQLVEARQKNNILQSTLTRCQEESTKLILENRKLKDLLDNLLRFTHDTISAKKG